MTAQVDLKLKLYEHKIKSPLKMNKTFTYILMALCIHTIKVKSKIEGSYLYNFVRKSMPALPHYSLSAKWYPKD